MQCTEPQPSENNKIKQERTITMFPVQHTEAAILQVQVCQDC